MDTRRKTMVIEIDIRLDSMQGEDTHTDSSIDILVAHEYEQNGPSELPAA